MMNRRREQASQQSSRRRHHGRNESDSDDEVEPTNVVVASGPSDSDDEEKDEEIDGKGDDEVLDFTQPDYAVQMSQAELDADDDGFGGSGKKTNKIPTKPKVLQKLSDKALEELMAKLKLEKTFGLRVARVQDSSSKEVYLVLNNATSQEHLLHMNKTGKAASRGFLMMVLGLLWCAPGRRLSEGFGCDVIDKFWWLELDDLWKQLIRLDPKVKLKMNHPLLGDIPLLFKTFENQLYLDATSELDPDLKKIKYYQYGPRTLLEVSKVQILNFVCKVRNLVLRNDMSKNSQTISSTS
ncbi:hypothetical protein PsorP6_018791 [Peronosclerospora sorghi]|nr:hypothetical protein PsorP6_018791 [Peronosclerospora sorghi]